MSAQVEIESDAGASLTSWNFGAVPGGSTQMQKFIAKNIGNQDATSVSIYASRLGGNDGLDFVQLALDASGNPGAFSKGTLNIGTLVAGASIYFWAEVVVPAGVTPAGNPRQFDIIAQYSGT